MCLVKSLWAPRAWTRFYKVSRARRQDRGRTTAPPSQKRPHRQRRRGVLVDIAKTPRDDDGRLRASGVPLWPPHDDVSMLRAGTTSVAVLCGELLREAEKLIDARVHPQTIAAGWRLAAKLAKAELEMAATRETDDEKFSERLLVIARTTLSSKLVLYEKEHFAKLAVDAVLRLKGSDNLDYIQSSRSREDSSRLMAEGSSSTRRSACSRSASKRPRSWSRTRPWTRTRSRSMGRVKVDSLSKVAAIEQAEKDKMVWRGVLDLSALRHRCDSSPSDEATRGLFFDFEPFRAASGPSRRVRATAAAAMASPRDAAASTAS